MLAVAVGTNFLPTPILFQKYLNSRMNTDRRSGYSQNYGQDYPSGPVATHARNESAMSNFAPRPSREALAGNRDTQYDAPARSPALNGDDFNPESGWNVYSDFNNTGPRYSTMKTTTDG